MALYVVVSIYIGRLCYLSDKINKKREKAAKEYLKERSELGWFSAEHFFSLGLLGTIIGLIISTQGSLDSSFPTSEIVAILKYNLTNKKD